ncbi:MAG: spondin domain-containing protein [Rhodothermales bacterium]|nr:spondin domain-containing protein [Rhodothermales bacterium]
MKSLVAVFLVAALVAGCSQDGGLTAVESDAVGSSGPLTAASLSDSRHNGNGAGEYEVTIINMSHSQPFSPGVVVTHDGTASVFSSGSAASEGIREIAENGNPGPAFDALNGAPGVSEVVNTGAPVFTKNGPGSDKLTLMISAGEGAEYLSMAIMLICTNDGFVGLDTVELPKGPETAVFFPGAYDAGTEANDELYTSIVDPCGAIGPVEAPADGMNNRTATADNIEAHPGISGGGDLDATAHSWRNKVARVTVKRIG